MAVVLLGTPVTTFATEVIGTAVLTNTTVTSVAAPTGYELKDVTKVEIPANATDIAANAFDQCTNLEKFTVAGGTAFSVDDSGDDSTGALYNYSTTNVWSTLYRLPPAFKGTYTLPASVSTIKEGAFTNCAWLQTFHFGDSSEREVITRWDDYSFTGCSSLTAFTGEVQTYAGCTPFSTNGDLLLAAGSSCTVLRVPPALRAAVLSLDVSARDVSFADGCLAGRSAPFVGLFTYLPQSLSVPGGLSDALSALLIPSSGSTSLSPPVPLLRYSPGSTSDSVKSLTITSAALPDGTSSVILCPDAFSKDGYSLALDDSTAADASLSSVSLAHTYDDNNRCTVCGAAKPIVPVTGVTLSDTAISLAVGDSAQLTATVLPETATNNDVTWSSSNSSVATVDENGNVTAVGPGSATITVTTVDGSFSAACGVSVVVPEVSVDRSSWGTPYTRGDGVVQYVVEDPSSPDYGMTSVELAVMYGGGGFSGVGPISWVLESSGGSSAWYGLRRDAVFEALPSVGYRFYVQWLSPGDAGYAALYDQLDDETKQQVERDNGWLFNMGIRAPDGSDVHYLSDADGNSVSPIVYVQIGDDWDVDDLNAYYIASGADETVPVDYLTLDYPGGTDTFGRMTLDHFSPYFIFDELTADEKATLVQENSGPENNVKTGDQTVQVAVAGLGMTLVLALGVMLRLLTNKRKFEE